MHAHDPQGQYDDDDRIANEFCHKNKDDFGQITCQQMKSQLALLMRADRQKPKVLVSVSELQVSAAPT